MMESSPSRVSRIPELVSFICRFATPHTRRSLLRVSRSYFNIAAPIVWERVQGVHNLLRLIPGVGIAASHDLYFEYKSPNTITIALPPVLDLDRFNLYAPYVQKLEIYTSNGDPMFYDQITLSNWTLLSTHSQRHTLLPNLSQLTLTSPCGRADETELFIWAGIFMSPGLTTLRVNSDTSVCQYLSFSFASTLARHAKSTCPDLHTLSLVTSDAERIRTWSSKSTQLSSAFAFWEPSYYQSISAMSLRELCCGAGILLSSNIPLVGQLACLERLELYCGSESLSQNPAQLGPEFLPLLNELSLVTVHWSDITSVLEMDIYSRVKSLSIRMPSLDQELESFQDSDESSIDLEPIVLYTPALIKLQIDFGGSFAPRDASALQVLDALSLQDLTLVNVSLAYGTLEKLPLIFPLAHTIRIPQCELSLEDLQCFSQSSELVHLAVDLSLSPPGLRSPLQPSSGFQVAPKFRTLEINASSTNMMVDLSLISRCLLSIWPNLQQVVQTSNSDWPYEDYVYSEGNVIIANALNALISAYRTISNLSK